MRGSIISLAGAATLAMTLAGCMHTPFPDYSELPPDYSPRYTSVAVVTPSGREKRVLVPEACITPDQESEAEMGAPRIAPGCANNYNLQRMVERKHDLTQGRKLDKAPAAPAARAAQRYLDGKDPALGGGIEDDDKGTSKESSVSTQ
jgi:hypothetical protein